MSKRNKYSRTRTRTRTSTGIRVGSRTLDEEKGNFFNSRGFVLLLILVAFVLLLTFFFGDSGVFEIVKTRNRIAELKQNIQRLEGDRKRLVTEIEELKENPLALEKKARRDLWLMKKNEKVIVVVREKNSS